MRRSTAQVGCPGSGGTTWTITPNLPWSLHHLYDQTTNQFITVIDSLNVSLSTGASTCRFVGSSQLFSDIGQPSTILGSLTNPVGSTPGKANFGFGSTILTRASGNSLICPATANGQGTYQGQGLRANGTLFNIWQRNQGARAQG
jgi:hypothetical protein